MHSLACPAKINLFLEVTGKRSDGYHNIESVFQTVSLADTLSAEPRGDDRITLECDSAAVPLDESNLIIKAANLLRREYAPAATRGIHFRLEKRIPMGAGLGGGSTDAAAALRLADRLWETRLSLDQFASLGGRLGSDVPFFFHGGTCLCRGRGEIIERLPDLAVSAPIVLVLTNIHSNTAAAYGGLHLPGPGERRAASAFVDAMRTGDAGTLVHAAFNRFESTVFSALPDLGELHARLSRIEGIMPRLSGSGSALWFFGSENKVWERIAGDNAFAALAKRLELRLVKVLLPHIVS